jgi:FixJ family two-component response regulator
MAGAGDRVVKVIDDDEPVRDSICALLAAYDLPAMAYRSVGEALQRIDWDRAGCVLIDQHMPGPTGLDFVRTIRSQGLTTPVIMMSGRAEDGLDARALQAGASAFLAKPIDDRRLIELVTAAMRGV